MNHAEKIKKQDGRFDKLTSENRERFIMLTVYRQIVSVLCPVPPAPLTTMNYPPPPHLSSI